MPFNLGAVGSKAGREMKHHADELILDFHASPWFSLGIEVELQLLDPDTMALSPKALDILETLPPGLEEHVKQEFIQSMLEVNTSPCPDFQTAYEELRRIIVAFHEVAAGCGASVFVCSLHPFSSSHEQVLFPDPRYARILDEMQLVGRQLITQGLHCHVGVPDRDIAIRVFDRIRPLLPLFLALSCSSPIFHGEDTGLSSYRSKLFDALPRSGMPEALGRWNGYEQLLNVLYSQGIIQTPRDVWWDVRLSPGFGTIEIRICDVPIRFKEIMALVALIQATVAAIAQDLMPWDLPPRPIIQTNKWQAARYGLNGRFISIGGAVKGNRLSISDAILQLLDLLYPVFQELGSEDQVDTIIQMIRRDTGSNRMRAAVKDTGNLPGAIRKLQQGFWE